MSDPVGTGSPNPLHLDELFAGQRFRSGSYAISAEEITAFARQFDPQPFHLGEESARGTFFGALVASGWHTAALSMRLNVEGGLPISGGIIGAGGEVSWPTALRPGDVIHVESEITEIVPSRSRPDRGTVTVLSHTLNQRSEVVQILKMKLVALRRPAV